MTDAADAEKAERDARREKLFDQFEASGAVGDRNALVESFAPLAEYFAKRYRNRGAADEDLRQVAQLGLVKAVDRFDRSFGVQFSTFAGRTIDGELKRYFRDKTWAVRVPRGLKERSADVRRAADQLSTELGRSPTVSELVAATDYEHDEVLEALDVQQAYSTQSIDRPTGGEDGDRTLADTMGSTDRGMEGAELRVALERILETLPEREQTIVRLRFFDELSQSEIADQVGISQMHVSRLLRRSLDELRTLLR